MTTRFPTAPNPQHRGGTATQPRRPRPRLLSRVASSSSPAQPRSLGKSKAVGPGARRKPDSPSSLSSRSSRSRASSYSEASAQSQTSPSSRSSRSSASSYGEASVQSQSTWWVGLRANGGGSRMGPTKPRQRPAGARQPLRVALSLRSFCQATPLMPSPSRHLRVELGGIIPTGRALNRVALRRCKRGLGPPRALHLLGPGAVGQSASSARWPREGPSLREVLGLTYRTARHTLAPRPTRPTSRSGGDRRRHLQRHHPLVIHRSGVVLQIIRRCRTHGCELALPCAKGFPSGAQLA